MKTTAKAIVDAVLHDLEGRAGIGDEYDMIDDDVRKELRADWVKIVTAKLEP